MKEVMFLSACDLPSSRVWSLSTTLPNVLQSQDMFRPFQHFMIQHNGLPYLLFCLDVEVVFISNCPFCILFVQSFIQSLQSIQLSKDAADPNTVKKQRDAVSDQAHVNADLIISRPCAYTGTFSTPSLARSSLMM